MAYGTSPIIPATLPKPPKSPPYPLRQAPDKPRYGVRHKPFNPLEYETQKTLEYRDLKNLTYTGFSKPSNSYTRLQRPEPKEYLRKLEFSSPDYQNN